MSLAVEDSANPLPVAVVGGGISGLAAAHRLKELETGHPILLLESRDRLGGVLETVRQDGYLIETSADNFITKLPYAEQLAERLGLAGELLPTEPSLRRALTVNRGKVVPVPEAFVLMSAGRIGPILSSPILGWRGKLRLFGEPLVPRRTAAADESVADFARRRLGDEAFRRLVQPLVAGIYTADPEKLSMQATMRQFVERERQHGSLWRARRAEASGGDSGARYSAFVAPRQGMTQLVEAVAASLPPSSVRLGTTVETVRRQGHDWHLDHCDGQTTRTAAVIVATPAAAAGRLLAGVDAELARKLRSIEQAGASIVVLGVRSSQVKLAIRGFGFVVPQIEGRRIIAASFSSLKFPGRAPDDRLLIRVFVGGALQPELADLPDDQLVELARGELAELVGLEGEPELTRVVRWPSSMPQYHVGHIDRIAEIERRVAAQPGLDLAGNAYHGVGIPQCVHSGEVAAERIAEYLRTKKG